MKIKKKEKQFSKNKKHNNCKQIQLKKNYQSVK